MSDQLGIPFYCANKLLVENPLAFERYVTAGTAKCSVDPRCYRYGQWFLANGPHNL